MAGRDFSQELFGASSGPLNGRDFSQELFGTAAQPEPRPEDQSIFRSVADPFLKAGAGVVMGVRMIADAFGAGSETSQTLRGAEDWIAALYSAQSQRDSKKVAQIIDAAKDKGVWEQVKAGVSAFLEAPIDIVSQGLGTAAPTILASLATTVLGAPAAVTTAVGLGLGATMGAGTVKGAIYDAVKEELAKTNMPKDEIEKRAELAQRYNGENLDQILMGAGIGGLAARSGLESSVARAAAARITGKAAAAEAAEAAARQQVAKETAEAAARGPLLQGARTAATESGTEFLQGSQEQVAQNIALQREGFDVPTFRGAVAQGTLVALAGAPLGAGFGAREAIVARQEEARLADIANAINISALGREGEQALEGVSAEEAEIQDRMIELMASRYESIFPKELAYAVALQMNEIRQSAEAEAKALGLTLPETAAGQSTDTTVGVDPMRVRDLEDSFLNAGAEPGTAKAAAIAQATEEAYADWIAERGVTNVGQPVTPAGGEGVRVAGEPPAGTPAGGAGVAGTDGVVSPATDAGLPAAGEATAPGTLEQQANQWDRQNKLDRSGAWFEGAKSNEDAVAGFNSALQNGGDTLPAHGMAKESTLVGAVRNLLAVLTNGLDPSRRGGRLDYAPLVTQPGSAAAMVSTTPGGNAYSDGPFILVARPGQEFEGKLEGLGAILVNQANADIVPALRAAVQAIRPDVLVEPYSNAGEVAKQLTGAPSGTQAPQAVEAKEERPAAAAAPAAAPAKPTKPEKPLNAWQLADKLASEVSESVTAEAKREELKQALEARGIKPAGVAAAVNRFNKKVSKTQPKARAAKTPKLSLRNARFAGVPKADKLYRSEGTRRKYPGFFWSSILEYVQRYLKQGADQGKKKTFRETAELPKRTLNITTLSQASKAEKDAMLAEFSAWMQKNAPNVPVEDTQLYDVLTDQSTDFAYPQKADVKYLKYMGYDSVFFAEEGGEKVDTWFVFDKKERAEATEPKPKRDRGRPALPAEEREARAKARTDVRAQANRDARRLQKAAEALTTKNKERRTDALYNLYDIYKTSQSTPRRSQAKGMLDANTTEAERRTIEDGYTDWQANQAKIAAFEAAQREQNKATRLTPEERQQKQKDSEAARDKRNRDREQDRLDALEARASRNWQRQTVEAAGRKAKQAKQTEQIRVQREDKIKKQKDKIAALGKKLAAFRQNKPVNEAELLLKEKQYKLEQLRLKVFEEKPIDWDADWEQGTKVRSLEDAAQEIRALQPKKEAKKGMTFEQQLATARQIESKLKAREPEEDVGAVVEQVTGARGRKAAEEEAGANDIALAGLFDPQVEEEVEAEVEAEPAVESKAKKPAEDKWAGVKRTTRGTVELVPTSSLTGVKQRNKTDTKSASYRALKASIAKQGIVDPITLTLDSTTGKVEVFEGNHRLQVARELGIKQVPVVLHKRINPSESVELEGIKPSEVLPAAESKKPVEEPKQLTPQEQYAALVENIPGAPAFDALSEEAQKQITDLAERNQLNLAAISRIASEKVKEAAPKTLSQQGVRSGKSFLSSDYVYHAVRSDEDIASIVANGLNPDTNVSFYDSKLEGQAFAGEGDTILVFRKDDAEPELKGYQADGLATKRAKPVAIFKDTGLEANQPTQDEIADEANPLFEESQRLEEYLVREYNLNESDARQLKTFIATARAERPEGLPKEADDTVKRIRSLSAKVDSLLDRFEQAPEKRVDEAEVVSRYSGYGVPVYGINLDFDERRDATTISFSTTAAPKFSQTANVDTADARFSKFTTAGQATAHVARTGNAFQRALARRLSGLKILQNTKFVVLEPDAPLPKELKGDPGWASARGVYIPSTDTIYVRSASDAMQGANNITVLHEALHAALQAKINAGRQRLKAYRDALLRGKPVSGFATEVEGLFVDLSRIARRAEAHFRSLKDMPEELLLTVASTQNEQTGKFEIFTNLDEFLSYGMSDPVFQDFLKTVPMEGTTGFSRFVQAILRFLGMASGDQSALSRLVDATDKLIAVPGKFERAKRSTYAKNVAQKILKTAAQAEAPARRYPKEVEAELKKLQKTLGSASSIQRKAREQAANADKILAKVLRSHSSSTEAMQGLQQAVNNRGASGQNLNDVLAAQYKGFKGGALRQLLPALQTETVVDWAGRLGLNNVVLAWDQMKNLHAAQVKGLNDAAPISERLVNLQRTNPGMYRALAATMHYSTLRGVDPSTEAGRKASPSLARFWNSLNPEAKSLYETVRDFHAKNYDRHFELLEKLVDSYGLEGNIADASTPKGSLIASIRRMQEQGAGIKPYFPLMRFGNFWVRTGKGKDSTFHMFESQAAKEAFIEQHVRGTGKSKADLYADELLKDGNDISSARKDMGNYNELLQRMFANIDSMETQEVIDDFGNPSPELARIRKEQLKDNIYQMILHTLPDASYRKQFIHRQGKEGFSEDIARSFATLSTAMANQLARLEYSQQIQNALSSARSALENNPDAARLNEFIKEMEARAKLQLDPSPENSIGNQMANFANQTAFVYMMTNIKTAVAQMFAVPMFVAPVLQSKHGIYRTAKALGSFAAIWNSVGMRKENADGSTSWVAPTIAQSKRVKLNPEERRAAQYMVDRGLSETTLAYDLGNRKQTPTEVQNSAPRRMLKASVNAMTALFHHTERLIREVAFMASFRLNRKKFPDASFEEIAQLAEKETLDALGNYASINRPRGLGANAEGKVMLDAHKPMGRAVLQFKMFPAFVTTYFVRNFYRMMGKGYTAQERKAAFVQFFGTLMTSFTLAGVMGIPGFSFALGVLNGLRKIMADDDDDDPLGKRNLELWFRNIWMPQTFGDIKIGGKPLSDIMDKGVLAAMTGFDMTNSLSMNGLWLPTPKESPSVEASVKEYLLAIMGPFASLIGNQVPRAIDNFNRGKLLEGMEQMMPAILRSPITAYRYSTEGAQTTWGAEIKPASEFTLGQIIGQSLGFSTEGLVARREDLFKANQLRMQVRNEKRSLMDRLDQEVRTEDDVQAAIEKIVKFNQKNWFDPIKGEELSKSLINRMERRAKSERGLEIEKKYYPQLFELLEGSRRKLEAEAAK